MGGGISTLLVFPCKKVWELNNVAELNNVLASVQK